MAKVVAEPKMKVYQAKKKEGNFSEYSNLSTKAPAGTQTVSKSKLIRGLLRGIGYRVQLGNPIATLDANINLHIKQLKKDGVNSEVIVMVKNQVKNNQHVNS